MPNQDSGTDSKERTKRWGKHLQDAAGHVEEDLRRVVTFINDEVVPDIRRNSSHALRAAAVELEKLAAQMERRQAGPAASSTDRAASSTNKDAPRP